MAYTLSATRNPGAEPAFLRQGGAIQPVVLRIRIGIGAHACNCRSRRSPDTALIGEGAAILSPG